MKRKAFTLIELIIATVTLAVIVVSIYSAFSVGLKAWRRGGEGEDFQKIRIALLKMQKELRSSFFFSKAPFKGTSSEIIFPLVISGEDKDFIYVIKYYTAEDKTRGGKALIKKETIYTDKELFEEEQGGGIEELVFSADLIDFEYAYKLQDRQNGFKWRSAWEESQKKIPSAVKINFMLGPNKDIYHKIIFISQGELGIE